MAMTSRWWRIGCLLLGCAVAFNNVFADEEDTLAVATVASVTTAPATAATISRYLTAYGTVEFSADHLHALSVPYQARVVSVLALAGQALHQGDPIIVLKPTATAELERQHAGSDAQFAQSELHRVRTLFAQHLATNSEVAAAEQAARNAEATQTAARGRFGNLAERTLHADSDGIVVSLTAHHDDILAADTQFAQIGDNNGLQLRLGIEPSAGAQVTTGQNVSFTLLQNDARPMQAKVERVSHQLDAQTRLIDVYATPDKPEQLSPGTAVTAKIEIATRPNVLSVPRSAVLYRDGNAFVFAIAAGKAAQRWVDVGDDDGTRIEIRSGLEANTPVVTLGNYELRDGMAVRVQ